MEIDCSVTVKITPNQMYHAHVRVGRWHAISEDHLTEEDAQSDGENMMADMMAELEELINA